MDKVTVSLPKPARAGGAEVSEIEPTEPNAGQLRGVSLVELMRLQPDALIKLLPRITSPAMTAQEAAAISPRNLVALGAAVIRFLGDPDGLSPGA